MKEVPKYLLVANKLKHEINAGEYKPNDQLPKEMDLVNSFNVSRITVRNALNELENEGLIYRIQGAGTFVKEKEFISRNNPDGFELINLKEYHYKVIDFGVGSASTRISQKLQINPNDIVFHIKRFAMKDKNIVAFQNVWLPAKIINNLNMEALEASIYPIVEEKVRQKPKQATREFSVAKVDDKLLNDFKDKLLKKEDFDKDEPLLKCEQISILENDQPFETTETLYRINKYPIKEVVMA